MVGVLGRGIGTMIHSILAFLICLVVLGVVCGVSWIADRLKP